MRAADTEARKGTIKSLLMSNGVGIRTQESGCSPSISTATLFSLVWGPGETLLIPVRVIKARAMGNAVEIMKRGRYERQISQNWPLGLLERQIQREV